MSNPSAKELAEKYALEYAERLSARYETVNVHDAVKCALNGFEAGHSSRDEEVVNLKDELRKARSEANMHLHYAMDYQQQVIKLQAEKDAKP